MNKKIVELLNIINKEKEDLISEFKKEKFTSSIDRKRFEKNLRIGLMIKDSFIQGLCAADKIFAEEKEGEQ